MRGTVLLRKKCDEDVWTPSRRTRTAQHKPSLSSRTLAYSLWRAALPSSWPASWDSGHSAAAKKFHKSLKEKEAMIMSIYKHNFS